MANEEHLAIVNRGVEAWNKWREENVDTIPDLSGANLSGTQLIGADLSKADLSKADLRWAQLIEADLRWVDLRWANLSGAQLIEADLSEADLTSARLSGADLTSTDLSGADLTSTDLIEADLEEADLSEANLSEANLSGANLSGADLRGANLSGADLSFAEVGWTIFGDIDLSYVKELELVHHLGPSTIGIDTIYMSGGGIPEVFLRGAGVPENFITFMQSLTNAAFDFYSCFISYSSKDQSFVERLYADLQNKGVRCWYAPKDMKTGDRVRQTIFDQIRLHEKLLVVLSEHSIASAWVEDEVDKAIEEERQNDKQMLFPIRLDNAVMETDEAWAAKIRHQRHITDFTDWKHHDTYQQALDRLMHDLKVETRPQTKGV